MPTNNRRDAWRAQAICEEMQFNPLRRLITRYLELEAVHAELKSAVGFHSSREIGVGAGDGDAGSRRQVLLDELAREMDRIAEQLMPYLYPKASHLHVSGSQEEPLQLITRTVIDPGSNSSES